MSEEQAKTFRTLIAEARAAHPFPWTRIVHQNGLIQIADARGMEVPLLLMTDVLCMMTLPQS